MDVLIKKSIKNINFFKLYYGYIEVVMDELVHFLFFCI